MESAREVQTRKKCLKPYLKLNIKQKKKLEVSKKKIPHKTPFTLLTKPALKPPKKT